MNSAALAVDSRPLVAQCENLREGLDELKMLLPIHYGELSGHKDHGYKLAPQYREYLARWDCGQVLYVTLRDERRLIGYFVGFVTRCLHYQALTLSMDIFYVLPTSRGLQGGHVLLDAVEAEATRRGIDPCRMGFKEQFAKHMTALLRERSYEPFERTWVKWLRTTAGEGDNATDV